MFDGICALGVVSLTGRCIEEVAPFYTDLRKALACARFADDNAVMRALAGLVVVAALALGVYEYSLRRLPTTDQGTAPTQAISLTGVRADLLKIAQAERLQIASNGQCATLEELISSNSVVMAKAGRDGYTYSIQCSGTDFTVSAQHAPAPPDSPIRYPNLATDQTMEIHEVN